MERKLAFGLRRVSAWRARFLDPAEFATTWLLNNTKILGVKNKRQDYSYSLAYCQPILYF